MMTTFLRFQSFLLYRFSLITSADHRLTVDQIKKHAFFYGVDWETIRRIDAPFVPQLRSITDTSYFPTDEIDQVDEEPPADASSVSKDLAFLGSVYFVSYQHAINFFNVSADILLSGSMLPN